MRLAYVWLVSALLGLVISGCTPAVDMGQCGQNQPCEGRGEVCDLTTNSCILEEVDLDSTEDPAPMTFTDKAVPFFRGRMCLEHDVKAGTDFPVYIAPCLHPCIEVGQHQFKHSWSCIGSTCEAYAVMWVMADSADGGCPATAFGRFDQGSCNYPRDAEFTVKPRYDDGTLIEGTMLMDIPFLSNADATRIAADPNNSGLLEDLIFQYPQEDSRVPGGMPISLLNSNSAPPATCGENGAACNCFDIGF